MTSSNVIFITRGFILITLLCGISLFAITSDTNQSSFYQQTDTGYYWNENSEQWVLSSQTIRTFNGNDQIIEKLDQDWDGLTWTNNERNTWTYNSSGFLTGELYETWHYSDEQWKNYSKIEYVNDFNGNYIERTVIEYHEIPGFTQVWWNKGHFTYTYDSANKLTEAINQTWSSDHWSNSSRYTYTYDASGNLSVMLGEGWYFSTWLNENLTTYSYNSSGVEEEMLHQHWDDPDRNGSYEWTNNQRQQNHIDANNLIDGTHWQRWASTDWQYVDKQMFTFDTDFNIIEILDQEWDTGINYWVSSEQTFITYQNWGTIADFTADVQTGKPPLTVQFTDLSFQAPEGNSITGWAWDFNDDGVIDATDQSPSYTYTEAGGYTVTLIASDGITTDTLRRNNFISIPNSNPAPILTIIDVPNDEGGELLIQFTASSHDVLPVSGIDKYDVYVSMYGDTVWTVLESIPATGASSYSVSFSTVADAGDINNEFRYYFYVLAMFNYNYYYDTSVLGYSLDNLAPAPIGTLNASVDGATVELSWDASSATDFDHYIVSRDYSITMENALQIGVTEQTSYIDSDIASGGDYYYQVAAVDNHGNQSAVISIAHANILTVIDESVLPTEFALYRNYPNPFNPTTTFEFALPSRQQVNFSIYDLNGHLLETLVDNEKPAGNHSVKWNASGYSTGVYLYRFDAGEFHSVRKCILMK